MVLLLNNSWTHNNKKNMRTGVMLVGNKLNKSDAF